MSEGFVVGMVAATFRMATPLILGSLGEVLIELVGILNLGIEGIMTLGAFVGFLTLYLTGDPWLGIFSAGVVGALLGVLMGFLVVTHKLQQHVSGLGMTVAASGLALFLFEVMFGESSVRPQVAPLRLFKPLGGIPIIGEITKQYPVTYLALLLIPLTNILVFKTALGLRIRAVGEAPLAADVAGVNVARIRYTALAIGSGLMGIAGAFLSVAQLGYFSYDIVAGRGWICLAVVAFGNWQPLGAALGALLFGGVEALQLRLQTIGYDIPYQVFLALPYAAVILSQVVKRGEGSSPPKALAEPYEKE